MQIIGDSRSFGRRLETMFSRRRNSSIFQSDTSMASVLCDDDTTVQNYVVDRSPSRSPGMESDDSRISHNSSRTSIWIEEDLRYLQHVTVDDTIPFVPNIRYGKVLSIENGRTFTVAARIFNGYTTVLSPHTYRFQLTIAGTEILSEEPNDVAYVVLQHMLVGHIVHIPHIDIEPTTGQLHVQVYIGDIHLNRWMIEKNLVRSSLCGVTDN